MFNQAEETDLESVACAWLNHEVVSHSLTETTLGQPWYQNFPVTRKNHLYIGKFLAVLAESAARICCNFSLQVEFSQSPV